VRLQDNVADCVVYLGTCLNSSDLSGKDMRLEGTGFIILYGDASYVVTARHVAQDLEPPFHIRYNNKQGLFQAQEIDSGTWWHHPVDNTADVAVMQIEVPSWAEVSPWIPKWFVSRYKKRTKDIGAGDLAYIVGMYKWCPGETLNTPVYHTGHIARMDIEPIRCGDWRKKRSSSSIEMDACLIEAQTLDGLSGSPVFVRRSIATTMLIPHMQATPLKVWVHGSVWLLGLWHGAWFGHPIEEVIKNTGPGVKVSAGMGVVVPAWKILEVLDRQELASTRNSITATKHADDAGS
jgi:hypothetical protein